MNLRSLFLSFLPTFAVSLLHPSLFAAASGPIQLYVNTADFGQTIEGFGACIVDYDLLPAYQNPAFYDRAVFDMGMSLLRLPMGGVEVDGNDNDDPRSFDWSRFEPAAMGYGMEIARQFQARGIRKILVSQWSPPAWMKTNRSTRLGGRLRPDMRDEFAEYLSAYVRAADRAYGVKIDVISLQNELLFVEPYNSCVYNPMQLRETLRDVMRYFDGSDRTIAFALPEEMGWAERFQLYLDPILVDAETRRFDGILVAHGWNGTGNWERMGNYAKRMNKALWMTETSGHNPDWAGGLALADNLQDMLVGGEVSAYFYWQFSSRKADRFALFESGEYTPKAYALKHFARFIRPGARRVYADCAGAALRVSAFKHPESGDLTLVLVNRGSDDVALDLRLTDATGPLNFLTFTSVEGHYFETGTMAPEERVSVPANGIVTLYGRSGETLSTLPTLMPEGWRDPPLGEKLSQDSTTVVDERLHAAARANDVKRVRELLAEGVDPDGINVGGFSPLHRAAWPGHVEMIAPLVAAGADPNGRDGSGGSPLLLAAGNGHAAFIAALVKAGADVNQQDNQGLAPIHRAALAGETETVALLLRLGADPNLKDAHGWGALHWAAASTRDSAVGIVPQLLEAGADPNARDLENKTPLHVAAANGINPRISLGGETDGSLYLNAERLRLLVEAGAAVNARDIEGRTPLHWVAWMGETYYGEQNGAPFFHYLTEAARYLVAAGADPRLKDHGGRTAVDLAASEGYWEMVSFLGNVGARPWLAGGAENRDSSDPQVQGNVTEGDSVRGRELREAAAAGDIDRVRHLLRDGVDPNAMASQGGAPLHEAVIAEHLAVVKLLLAAGADPELRDSDGYTPLGRALQNGNAALIAIFRDAK